MCKLTNAIRSRRWLRVSLALLLLAGVGMGVVWFRSFHPVNQMRSQFERVHKGMTRDEVIQTVGGPPGNYSIDASEDSQFHVEILEAWYADYWRADDADLAVIFDSQSRAVVVQIQNEKSTGLKAVRKRLARWLP